MDEKEMADKVMEALCEIAFSPGTGAAGQQVRCLEILTKLLGLQDRPVSDDAVTIVEDI